MSKVADQKFVKWHKATWKTIRTRGLKLTAIALGLIVPGLCLEYPEYVIEVPIGAIVVLWLILLLTSWALWYLAAKIAGPDLGKAPGRAGKATLEDARRVGMDRPNSWSRPR